MEEKPHNYDKTQRAQGHHPKHHHTSTVTHCGIFFANKRVHPDHKEGSPMLHARKPSCRQKLPLVYVSLENQYSLQAPYVTSQFWHQFPR